MIYENYDEEQISIYAELEKKNEAPRYAAKPIKKSGVTQRRCKKCGETGHRRDNCPNNQVAEDDESLEDKVQKLKDEGMTSSEVAKELGFTLEKVNKYW